MNAIAPPGLLRPHTQLSFGGGTICFVSASADGERVCMLTCANAVSTTLYLTLADARALGAALIQQAGDAS